MKSMELKSMTIWLFHHRMIFPHCPPRNSGKFCNLLSNSYVSVGSKARSRSVIGCYEYQTLEGWSSLMLFKSSSPKPNDENGAVARAVAYHWDIQVSWERCFCRSREVGKGLVKSSLWYLKIQSFSKLPTASAFQMEDTKTSLDLGFGICFSKWKEMPW